MKQLIQNHPKKAAAAAIAVALAAPMEGIKFTPYYDPPGILTVCEGHTGRDVVKGRVYSLAECRAFMDKDMAHAVDLVDACQPNLPEKVLASFADATYNMGPTVACDQKHSTAAHLLATGDWAGACKQLPRWNKARVGGAMIELPGLTKRRNLEMNLCLDGVADYQRSVLIEQHHAMTGSRA